MTTRALLLTACLAVVSCGPTQMVDDTVAQPNPYDDVALPLKCSTDPNQNCLEPRPNVVRIDDEDRLKVASSSWDAATQTLSLTLKPGVNPDDRVKVGTILYRGRKDRPPLLHRVESYERNGREVSVKLARVQLKDAFARGRIRVRLPMSSAVASQPLTAGKTQQPLEIALGPEDCSGNVFDKNIIDSVNLVQGHAKLDLTKCRFRLTAWVDAILEWDEGFANLDKFELSVGGSVEASMHSKLEIQATGAFGEQRRLWEGPEVPFSVGGIVITVNPSLFAGYRISGDAVLTVTHGFDLRDSIEVGFGYSDRLDWYSIDERNTRFTEFGPTVTFDGRVTAKAWLEPRLDVKAFGIAGATVTLESFAEAKMTSTATIAANGTASGQLCTSLDVGVTPEIGAVVEVLGVSLLNETMPLTTFRTTLVRDRCAAFTGPIPPNCDPSSPCCIDGQCGAPTEPGTSVRCKKGMPTTNGKFRFSCQTVYPDRYCTRDSMCADLSVTTTDSCVDYSCRNELNRPDIAATQSTSTTVVTGSLCIAPGCCHSKADCADAAMGMKRCRKPDGAGPSVAGTCN